MNIIKDIASSQATAWGDMAGKIDENFTEVSNKIPEVVSFEDYFDSLSSNTSLSGTEEVLVKKDGTFYKSTVNSIISLAGGGQSTSNVKIFTKDFLNVAGISGNSAISDYVGSVTSLREIVESKALIAIVYDGVVIPCAVLDTSSSFIFSFYWFPSGGLDSPGPLHLSFNYNYGQDWWVNVSQY